jgi:hypothetical protein
MKRLERLKNTVNKYMADLRPTSQNGSWSWVDSPVYMNQETYTNTVIDSEALKKWEKDKHKIVHKTVQKAAKYLDL